MRVMKRKERPGHEASGRKAGRSGEVTPWQVARAAASPSLLSLGSRQTVWRLAAVADLQIKRIYKYLCIFLDSDVLMKPM